MEKHPICISRTIKFSEKLIGIPCIYSNQKPTKDFPFYASNKKRINIEYIKQHGVCQVGLFNILRRFNKLPIHGTGRVDFYPEGSMASWVCILKKKLLNFKKNKKYLPGTILFANNKMAMVLKNNYMLHCNLDKGIVCRDKIEEFDFLYVCHPKYWILLE